MEQNLNFVSEELSSSQSPEKIVQDILASMDIHSYDPLIVPMLVEYLYKTVEDILAASIAVAEFSGKEKIDLKDVKTAMDIEGGDLQDGYLPSRNEMCNLASILNSQPLPERFDLEHMTKSLKSSIDNENSKSVKMKGNKKVKLNDSNEKGTNSFTETTTLTLPPAPDSLINHNILFLSSQQVQGLNIEKLLSKGEDVRDNNSNADRGSGKRVFL